MSETPLRVGVAGCGRIARVLHIPGYARSPHAEVVAFYNHRRETVEDLCDEHPQAEFFDDYDRFLREGDVEAVSICTPNALHAPMAVAALQRGIHVLVEKPMAVSLAEARGMIEASHESGAVLMVGQTQRYMPCHRRAMEIMQDGTLGRLFQMHMAFGHGGPLKWSDRGRWFVMASLAGTGVIGDLAVHKADLIRVMSGQEVESVAAFKAGFETEEVEDNAVAVLRLTDGTLVTLSASWTARGGSIDSTVLIGEKGTLRIGMELGAPLVLHEASGKRVSYDVPVGIPKVKGVVELDEVPEFVEAVRGTRPNPIPGEEGYRALEICIAMDKSARTARIVSLPLPAE